MAKASRLSLGYKTFDEQAYFTPDLNNLKKKGKFFL
jgi:hypothetical protein